MKYVHFFGKPSKVVNELCRNDHFFMNSSNTNQVSVLAKQYQKLKQRCVELKNENHDVKDALLISDGHIKDLEYDLIESKAVADHTPGALLFYSILHDDTCLEAIKTTCTNLQNVKQIIDGKEKYDFITLRRLLEPCCMTIPSIQRLIQRYQGLYKKWNKIRTNHYLERNENGGDADDAFVCPICMVDHRHVDSIMLTNSVKQLQNKTSFPSQSTSRAVTASRGRSKIGTLGQSRMLHSSSLSIKPGSLPY